VSDSSPEKDESWRELYERRASQCELTPNSGATNFVSVGISDSYVTQIIFGAIVSDLSIVSVTIADHM
jgi:hypothetical protein